LLEEKAQKRQLVAEWRTAGQTGQTGFTSVMDDHGK
jgi:hypothetical protein